MKIIKLFEEFKIESDFEKIVDLLEAGYSFYAACNKLKINRNILLNNLSQHQKRIIDEYRALNRKTHNNDFQADWNDYHRKSGEYDKLTDYDPKNEY